MTANPDEALIRAKRQACQVASIPHLGSPLPDRELGFKTPVQRIKLFLKRTVSTETKRKLKSQFTRFMSVTRRTKSESQPAAQEPALSFAFKPGDMVRIRSLDEIGATLDSWGELKGCGFMDGMEVYCGTVQRVWKPVRRFVDERDYRVKKTRGIYILENLICQGTKLYGTCDRSCFFFWREEWLEKVDEDGEV